MKPYATLIIQTPQALFSSGELYDEENQTFCPLGLIAREEGWNPDKEPESSGYWVLGGIFNPHQIMALYQGYDEIYKTDKDKAKRFAYRILRSWGYE